MGAVKLKLAFCECMLTLVDHWFQNMNWQMSSLVVVSILIWSMSSPSIPYKASRDDFKFGTPNKILLPFASTKPGWAI